MFSIRNLVLIVVLLISSHAVSLNGSPFNENSNSYQKPKVYGESLDRNYLDLYRINYLSSKIPEVRNQEITQLNNDYINRAFIMISGDDEFLTYAFAEGWPGRGTSDDPFIIKDYRLNTLTLTATSLDIIIRENIFDKIHTFFPPVRLYNVTNARIENNIIQTDDSGIYRTGILIQESQNCTIFNNSVFSPQIIPGEGSYGIIMRTSHNCTLIGNNITTMTENGIELVESHKIVISKNIINECRLSGMYIDRSTDCNLQNNRFSFNNGYGVYLGQNASSLRISMNDFINNSQDQESQAFDEGMLNNFINNYWNDWIEPDSNSNGIVDNPYNIDGQAENIDPSPWSSEEKWLRFPSPSSPQVRINVIFGSILFIVIVMWVSVTLKKKK
jgi:parallel beta-helix repeat protein